MFLKRLQIVEDASALIMRCDSDESRRSWQNRLQAAIYRASVDYSCSY